MKISVITINFNNSDGLKKSLISYFSQIDHFAEIIVIDGASNDSSIEVINQYKERINKLVIEKDFGIFNAMNKGIALSSGDFIYFLNSGEEFISQTTLSSVEKILIDSTKIYYFNIEFWFGGKLLNYSNNEGSWFVHQSCFVPLALMHKYKFDERFKIFGDLDLWTRLKKDGLFNLQYISETICRMRLDGIGSSPYYPIKKIKEKLYFARKHKEYFNSFISSCNIAFAYLISFFFGEEFLFTKYYPHINKMKNVFKLFSCFV